PLERGKLHGAAIIAKLRGIDTRTEAELMNRATIWVPATELAQLSEDEYYWYQLIGLHVVTTEGQPLGEIERLMETGANDVLVVMSDKDKKQILIPYIRGEVVKEVNLDQKSMIVDWQIDY
ncbi:MAG: ribosome maturation factor RimM, partial [Gammaproteobacteria bacterium]